MTDYPRYLRNATVEVKVDKRGRQFGQYWTARSNRWIRIPLDQAKAAIFDQVEAARSKRQS